jgi:hypothetical protein
MMPREHITTESAMHLSAIIVGAWSLSAAALAAQAQPDVPAVDETITLYAAAWNEPDAVARRRLLERAWAATGTYTDPTAHVEGRAALDKHIEVYLKTQPAGTRIVPASAIDAHHGRFRFAWKMLAPDGSVAIEGLDYGELDADGRISRIVGFFGPLAVRNP